MQTHELIHLTAYAKVNIGLRILGQRQDGYHDIETVFKLVSLCDRIGLAKNASAGVILETEGLEVPRDESNLCAKAVQTLALETGQSLGVTIRLSKRIPVGAGLGGGSSDAAAVLVGCRKLFRLALPDDHLFRLASTLGSDVPFFVGYHLNRGTTARGHGRGEILDYLPMPLSEKVLLVFPRIAVSTSWAYANFSKHLRAKSDPKKSSFALTNRENSVKFSPLFDKLLFFDNDFEPAVFANHDKIRLVAETMTKQAPIMSLMSGSGSTVFGIFEKDRDVQPLFHLFPDCDVFECTFV